MTSLKESNAWRLNVVDAIHPVEVTGIVKRKMRIVTAIFDGQLSIQQ